VQMNPKIGKKLFVANYILPKNIQVQPKNLQPDVLSHKYTAPAAKFCTNG